MPKGQRIGRYELVTPLAVGGMGEVFVGRITGAGGFVRHVVVKMLELGDDRVQQQAMFLDEARVLGRLHHQHIAPVFEIDEDKGKLFLVIDYVHGRTAQEVWQRARDLDSLLPLDFALTVIAGAASGLHHAHTRTDDAGQPLDIVHRDVSLSNVMVGYDGAVKLIDFGIAKARDRRSTTQAGFVKGKLGYLAPEQVRQQAVDARADVFALGICLYELTTMARPFRDQSDRMTAERIKSGAYRKPSELVEGYPAELEQIVATALRVDPRERFQSAEAMRRAIDALGHRHGLVLGDTAIAEVMAQLFEDRLEPWRRVAPRRPETDLDIAHAETVDVEALDPRDIPPVPGKKMRSATEIVESLASELDHVERLPAAELARAVVAVPSGEFDESVPTALAPAPAAAVEEPASPEDRVRSIQRLFTESAFDPRETPPKPLDSFGQTGAKSVVVDDPPRALTNRGIVDVGATTDGVQVLPPTAVAAPPPPKRARALLWIAVIVLVLGGAGAAVYALMFASPTAERAVDAAAAIADAAVAPDAASPDAAVAIADAAEPIDAPRTVTLKLTSVPTGATVVLDGKRLGKTPFEATLPIAPGSHTLKLRRTGYNTVKLPLDGDLVQEVTLTKAKPKVEEPKPDDSE